MDKEIDALREIVGVSAYYQALPGIMEFCDRMFPTGKTYIAGGVIHGSRD